MEHKQDAKDGTKTGHHLIKTNHEKSGAIVNKHRHIFIHMSDC